MTNLINVSRLAKLTAVLAASAALMSSAVSKRAKHRRPPSLRDQRSASQRKEGDARHQKEGDDRKEKGLRKNHCSHGRMWCERQKSCRQHNPHTALSGQRKQTRSQKPVPRLHDGDAFQRRHDVRNIQRQGPHRDVHLTRHNNRVERHDPLNRQTAQTMSRRESRLPIS